MSAVDAIKAMSIEEVRQEIRNRRNEREFREQAFREEITADFKAGKIAIENGWLVEVVDEHTCGTGEDGYYGQHEPGCGMVPIIDLWRAHEGN